jgi:CheY-like chemotaxis protein
MLSFVSNGMWTNAMSRQPEPSEAPLRQNQTVRGRVLVVDDDSPTLALMREVLEDCGYEVITRGDGLQALSLLSLDSSQFDMVITDHHMPNMTGLSLVREIRGIRSDMPIILCTGDRQALLQAREQMVGRHKVMQKPVNPRELTRIIRGMLDTAASIQSHDHQLNSASLTDQNDTSMASQLPGAFS